MSAYDTESTSLGGAKPIIPAGLQVQILTEQAEEAFAQFLKEEARMELLSRATHDRTNTASGTTTEAH